MLPVVRRFKWLFRFVVNCKPGPSGETLPPIANRENGRVLGPMLATGAPPRLTAPSLLSESATRLEDVDENCAIRAAGAVRIATERVRNLRFKPDTSKGIN
jgi:hypothetical protein